MTILALGLATFGNADEQFHGNPLRIQGEYRSRHNQTTYTLTLTNLTNSKITNIQVQRVGIWMHSRAFTPSLKIGDIKPQGSVSVKTTVKGHLTGLSDTCLIGMEGQLYHQGRRVAFSLPHPKSNKEHWTEKELGRDIEFSFLIFESLSLNCMTEDFESSSNTDGQ